MNPLTLVKRIQNINAREAQLGISEDASWHAKYKGSAYVYAGGLPFELTEGDLLAIFAQYGEVVDVNLVRDKGTGKSKGFAFVAYEDQRSTNLAVDNLNGAQVVGRTIRVDHVDKYKKKEEEDEEEEQRKREERGVCRAFQRGECTRGAGCKFSHNEQRAANTGWGAEDKKWGHDNYDGPRRSDKKNEDEDDEEKQRRREERGVCRAFQRGQCTRGAGCKFSHNEQRAANTGWGAEDRKWGHDSSDGPRKSDKRPGTFPSDRVTEPRVREDFSTKDKLKTVPDRRDLEEEKRTSRRRGEDDELEPRSREDYDRREEKRPRRDDGSEYQLNAREYNDRRDDRRPRRQGDDEVEPRPKSGEDKRLRRRGDDAAFEPRPREDHVRSEYNRREDRRPRRPDDDLEASDIKEDRDRMEEKRSRRPSHDESEPKSRASRDRMEGERLRRPDDDLEASDIKEDHDRMEEKRSRRPSHDESEPKSRASRDRREGERLRRHHDDEVPPRRCDDDLEASDMKADRDWMEEKRSRRPSHDKLEPKSRASRDGREGERLRRHDCDEVPPKSREDLQKGD